jgi:hypothetical protein
MRKSRFRGGADHRGAQGARGGDGGEGAVPTVGGGGWERAVYSYVISARMS